MDTLDLCFTGAQVGCWVASRWGDERRRGGKMAGTWVATVVDGLGETACLPVDGGDGRAPGHFA